MRAGELRHRATILKPRAGNNADGNPVQKYEPFMEGVPVAIHKNPWGREFIEARTIHGVSVQRIKMRYIPGITLDMRIRLNGRTYEIIPPIDNVAERNFELILTVKEVV